MSADPQLSRKMCGLCFDVFSVNDIEFILVSDLKIELLSQESFARDADHPAWVIRDSLQSVIVIKNEPVLLVGF